MNTHHTQGQMACSIIALVLIFGGFFSALTTTGAAMLIAAFLGFGLLLMYVQNPEAAPKLLTTPVGFTSSLGFAVLAQHLGAAISELNLTAIASALLMLITGLTVLNVVSLALTAYETARHQARRKREKTYLRLIESRATRPRHGRRQAVPHPQDKDYTLCWNCRGEGQWVITERPLQPRKVLAPCPCCIGKPNN